MLDGVIDFSAAVCKDDDAETLQDQYLFENDHLHLNAKGYETMGSAIDLKLFTTKGRLAPDTE